MASEANVEPGTLFTFPLPNGLYGACRVLRAPRADEAQHAGRVLVCATAFVGEPGAALKSADAKKILKPRTGPAVCWVEGLPPPTFTRAGELKVKGDLDRTSHSTAPWEMFPNVVFARWREDNQPIASRSESAAALDDSKSTEEAELERVRKLERIDLDGFVPLTRPKSEREPREVLRGFVAAMNRWERESARVAAAHGATVAVRLNRPALEMIFEEFCTPKDRPNGRLGSFANPPEYDPERQQIARVNEVGPRRVEIDAREGVGGREVRYVLLKTHGCWLIDGKKVDGRNGIL